MTRDQSNVLSPILRRTSSFMRSHGGYSMGIFMDRARNGINGLGRRASCNAPKRKTHTYSNTTTQTTDDLDDSGVFPPPSSYRMPDSSLLLPRDNGRIYGFDGKFLNDLRETYHRFYPNGLNLLSQVQSQRALAQHDSRRAEDNLRFIQESLRRLVKAIDEQRIPDAAIESANAVPRSEQVPISVLHRTFLEDVATYEAQLERLHASNRVVEASEHALHDLEHRLDRNMQALFASVPDAEPHLKSGPAAVEANDEANSAKGSKTPPQLRRYFSRKGDLRILEERRQDFIIDYQYERDERELRRDRDEVLETPDEVFERRYDEAWSALMANIKAAEDETRALEIACRIEGLDMNPKRRPSSDSSCAMVDRLGDRGDITAQVSSSEHLVAAPTAGPTDGLQFSLASATEARTKNSDLVSWFRSMQTSQPLPPAEEVLDENEGDRISSHHGVE